MKTLDKICLPWKITVTGIFLMTKLLSLEAQNHGLVLEKVDTVINNSQLGTLVRQIDGSLAVNRFNIGDWTQGGVVFWVDSTGQHGLVCQRGEGFFDTWHAGTNGNTQAKGDGPYSGEMNTAIIIAAHVAIGDNGSPYAARVCAELQDLGYGDWYLPSLEELKLMFLSASAINATIAIHGGTPIGTVNYWASTEINATDAWTIRLSDGVVFPNVKGSVFTQTRAIRAF
ncbi:MAG: DUF1566 domain-containing protein [Saprospiraceae bacterium]|nr:DUF1566 domain-containing protein [Saprospiraceae bacterium]